MRYALLSLSSVRTDLTIYFTSTWGDEHYLGLTSVELIPLDARDRVDVSEANVEAEPSDLSVMRGYHDDRRTLDKYVNKQLITN